MMAPRHSGVVALLLDYEGRAAVPTREGVETERPPSLLKSGESFV